MLLSRAVAAPTAYGAAWAGAGKRTDAGLGLSLVAFALLESVVYRVPFASVVSVAVCALALTVRRRVPIVVACAAGAAPLIDRLFGGPWSAPAGTLVAAVVASYTVARFAALRSALLGGAMILAGVWLRLAWLGVVDPHAVVSLRDVVDVFRAGYFGVLIAAPWLAGRASRAQRERAQTLELLTVQLERERELVGRLAVVEERARLARELHGTVARSVTTMLDDAEAATRALKSAPDRAVERLRGLQRTGRAAIGDLGRMLRVLRLPEPQLALDASAQQAAAAVTSVRMPWRWPVRYDLLLGLAALALTLVESRGNELYWQFVPLVLLLPFCLSLTMRQRYPIAVLITAAAAAAARHVLIGPAVAPPVGAQLVLFTATYSVATNTTRPRALAAVTVAILELWVADAIDTGTPHFKFLLILVFYASVPFLSGLAVRAYRLQAEHLRVLAERLRRERDARARLAVVEERTRTARDLHDTVARGVSVMVLQAGASERLIQTAPSDTRQALQTILDVGHETLDELERLLGTLEIDERDARRAPPTLARLDSLIAQTRRAGLPVTLHVAGHRSTVPASVDASAFRIIQESLTNALKHAGPAATAVTLRYEPDNLDLEIVNGRSQRIDRQPSNGGGHGVVGMRERVALHHGSLELGPQPNGGYRVHARLPLLSAT